MTIKLLAVSKSYGAIRPVEGLTLDVKAGETVCLLGRSGCGKSTALKLMALLTRPDEGGVWVEGQDVTNFSDPAMDAFRIAHISFSFQEPLLVPYLNCLENITVLTGVSAEKARGVLSRLGMSERATHFPAKLSGGEKRRVDVARAFVRGTHILLADEPFSYLDAETGKAVSALFEEHTETGGVVVYSAVEEVQSAYADRVVVMGGRTK